MRRLAICPRLSRSSPNEWYRWEKDLRQNPDIDILLSIDSTSFPLGTGSKQHEIWHSRLNQLSVGHRIKTARDLAQWLLSRGLDKQDLQDDLPQHGSQ